MNKAITVMCSGLILSACNSGTSLEDRDKIFSQPARVLFSKHRSYSLNNTSSLYKVGGTYDSMSSHPTAIDSCLIINESNITIQNPRATLDFTQSQSLETVFHALGVEFSAQFGFGPFSLNTSYQYGQSCQDDDYTLNINYVFQYAGKAGFNNKFNPQGESALTSTAKLALGDPQAFRQLCGDSVVGQLDASASVLIRLSLKFNSIIEKKYYDDTLKQVGGLENVLKLIAANPNNVKFHLSAAGLQLGGKPELLNKIFIDNGGKINKEGYPILDCGSNSNVSPLCINVINQVITYTQGLKAQLKTNQDYYLINPSLITWGQLGIDAKIPNANPMVVEAMQDLNKHYHYDYDNHKFINNYLQTLISSRLLSESVRQRLILLDNAYQRVVSLYTDPKYQAFNCFDGYVGDDCILIHDNLINSRAKILADTDLNQFLDYLKSNQYLIGLYIDRDNKAICGLSPITESNIYMVNCNGQVSGGIDNGVYLLRSRGQVMVNNLSYSYQRNQNISKFSYSFNQPLFADSFFDNMYGGIALISGDTDTILSRENVVITNILVDQKGGKKMISLF